MVAVDKPAGLLVHRSHVDRTASRFALQELRNLVGRHVFPVHRLDRPTSGVLLFALNPSVAQALMAAFARRQVEKTYLAVVRGWPATEGLIDYPLPPLNDPYLPENTRGCGRGQAAQTFYRLLEKVELPVAVSRYPTSRYALLEVHPHTGRRHQIRRHLKHAGHPVIGDVKYGEGRHNRFFRENYHVHRLLLTAIRLQFEHPISRAPVVIHAPLKGEFASLVRSFGWHTALPAEWHSDTPN